MGYQQADAVVDAVIDAVVPFHGGNGGKQGREGFQGLVPRNMIDFFLSDTHEGAYGSADVAIAGRLATPRGAINDGSLLGSHYNGIIVVHQLAAGDVLQPQTAMRALARTALAEEEITVLAIFDDGGMEEKGMLVCRSKGIHQHHAVVRGIGSSPFVSA